MNKLVAHVFLLLVFSSPVMSDWPKLESRTAAYVVGSRDEFCSPPEAYGAEPDPFGDAELELGAKNPPKRLSKPPRACRFFREGDELWEATTMLLDAKLLGPGGSWAVINDTTGRLVVSGVKSEHDRIAAFLDQCRYQPVSIASQVRLLKVRGRELRGVEWTEELVGQRMVEQLHEIALRARPGQKGHAILDTEKAKVVFDLEPNVGANDDVIDQRIFYRAEIKGKEPTTISITTGLTLWSDDTFYLEIGSRGDTEHTILLELKSRLQFLDGTPRSQGRDFEDPRDTPPPRGKHADEEHSELVYEDGLAVRKWMMQPTFLEDIVDGGDGAEPDPFRGEGEASKDPPLHEAPPEIVLPEGIAGVTETDIVHDVGELIQQVGVDIPKGGWAVYVPRTSFLVVKLDAQNHDLMEQLFAVGGLVYLPSRVRVTVSLIEWDGAEIVPGKIPARVRRLKKMAMVARPGQKAVLIHGAEGDEALSIREGLRMEIEPNIGANDHIVDLRLFIESRGTSEAMMSTGLTLENGLLKVLRFGRSNGKSFGAVIEASVLPTEE